MCVCVGCGPHPLSTSCSPSCDWSPHSCGGAHTTSEPPLRCDLCDISDNPTRARSLWQRAKGHTWHHSTNTTHVSQYSTIIPYNYRDIFWWVFQFSLLISATFVYYLLRFLDLSFNHISSIDHLETLVDIQKLFLIQNKLAKMENLSTLTNLTMLELGSNRIRVG